MEYALTHYGTKGMRWGVRRYQNEDGSYTQEGLARYRKDSRRLQKKQDRVNKYYLKTERRIGKLKKKSRQFMRNDDAIVRRANRYRRTNRKFQRSLRKANRFYRRFEKRYTYLLNSAQIDSGRRFTELYIRTSNRKLNSIVEA